jgi:hypothetical protein
MKSTGPNSAQRFRWRNSGVRPYLVLLSISLMSGAASAFAQTAPRSDRYVLQSGETRGAVSKSPLGKPCLDVEALSRPYSSNPRVYDHLISFLNRCPKVLLVRACYSRSDRCVNAEVPGYKRKDVILGIGVGNSRFLFTYSERR